MNKNQKSKQAPMLAEDHPIISGLMDNWEFIRKYYGEKGRLGITLSKFVNASGAQWEALEYRDEFCELMGVVQYGPLNSSDQPKIEIFMDPLNWDLDIYGKIMATIYKAWNLKQNNAIIVTMGILEWDY